MVCGLGFGYGCLQLLYLEVVVLICVWCCFLLVFWVVCVALWVVLFGCCALSWLVSGLALDGWLVNSVVYVILVWFLVLICCLRVWRDWLWVRRW